MTQPRCTTCAKFKQHASVCEGCLGYNRWEEASQPAPISATIRFDDRTIELPASSTQVGGSHYKDMAIQPFDYITKNGIGFAEGCAIKYLSRWRAKNGVEDLKKARHFIDMLIESEEKNG